MKFEVQSVEESFINKGAIKMEYEIFSIALLNKETGEIGLIPSVELLSKPKHIQLAELESCLRMYEDELENKFGACLQALHPTPSVGGLPKEAARQFILTKEKHDRAYYTGFLGPLNIQNKSHLFVNLRCLQLFNKQFVLYSGAGITAASIAENEWEETENKMMTMMNAMKNP